MNPTRRTLPRRPVRRWPSPRPSPPAAPTTPGAAATPSAGRAPAAEEGAFPVTITHKYGETTVEAAPERVVCVGLTEQDTLLALGHRAGRHHATGSATRQPGRSTPGPQEALGDAELPDVLDDTNGVEIEKVAALAPDLIIGQYSGMTEKEYELLSARSRPTVAQSGEYADYGMPWDEMALEHRHRRRPAGRRPGARRRGQGADRRRRPRRTRSSQGQTAAVVTPYEGLFVYGPEDPRSRMLVDLGFALPARSSPTPTTASSASRSAPSAPPTSAEVGVVGVARPATPTRQVQQVFEEHHGVRGGPLRSTSATADGDYYVAHSFVTPLSIPYVLDRYVPQLAAAADGDPATEPPGRHRLTRTTDAVADGSGPFDRQAAAGRRRRARRLADRGCRRVGRATSGDHDRQAGARVGEDVGVEAEHVASISRVNTSAGVPWVTMRRPSSRRPGRCSARPG